MTTLKYIVYNDTAHIVPRDITHFEYATTFDMTHMDIQGAGFVSIDEFGKTYCYGEAISLGIICRKHSDLPILNCLLFGERWEDRVDIAKMFNAEKEIADKWREHIAKQEKVKHIACVDEQAMNNMCHMMDDYLPKGAGFIVLTMEAPVDDGKERRTRYASNLSREDAIGIMKTWLLKSSAAEDWMKHID